MVRFCLDCAAGCRRAAEQASDAAQQRSWLEMEGRWFFLARSYDSQRRSFGPRPVSNVGHASAVVAFVANRRYDHSIPAMHEELDCARG